MKRYVQYDSFNIYNFEVDVWPHPEHNHTYCEIIFIRNGQGKHIINGNRFDYYSGDVFLLGPEDYHYFEISRLTQFCYIRFAESFMEPSTSGRGKNWRAMLSTLLKTPYQAKGSVVTSEQDKAQLEHLLKVLLYEWEQQHSDSFEVIMDSLLKVILSIIARNQLQQSKPADQSQALEPLMMHIRQYIRNPERLKIEVLADQFNFSKNYLSPYFKRQTGQSLQQYILRYKLTLIENRLLHSNLSISEIAAEFGFSDISHFHKIFRKYYGLAPKEYRSR